MSRSGYSDDNEDNTAGLWRGSVSRAINGKRGQAFLRDLLSTLDAMPEKRLIRGAFQETDGCVCALGSVCAKRGISTVGFINEWDDVEDHRVSEALNIAPALVKEIMFENDDDFAFYSTSETPEQRFKRVRAWVIENLVVKQ